MTNYWHMKYKHVQLRWSAVMTRMSLQAATANRALSGGIIWTEDVGTDTRHEASLTYLIWTHRPQPICSVSKCTQQQKNRASQNSGWRDTNRCLRVSKSLFMSAFTCKSDSSKPGWSFILKSPKMPATICLKIWYSDFNFNILSYVNNLHLKTAPSTTFNLYWILKKWVQMSL